MCESQAWLPIASLFGLLGCPVPVRLKAQILSTLAAFAKSPEIASSMWHTLELSQVGCRAFYNIIFVHNCRVPNAADVRSRTPEFASLTKVRHDSQQFNRIY